MSKASLWKTLLKEIGGFGDLIGEALTGTGKFGDDVISKRNNKELIKLAKKEPTTNKPTIEKPKLIMFHTKIPKEKEQKFFNRHMEVKNDRRKKGK